MKFDLKKFLIYLSCFIILVYPFNYTIKSKLFPNTTIMLFMSIIAFAILLFFSKIKKISKSQLNVLIVTAIVIGFELFRNYYLKENSEGKVLFFTLYLFLPFIVMSNEYLVKPFFKMIKFFCLEHVCGTFFVQFFKGIYLSYILPWLSNGSDSVAYANIMSGYNPGLTLHYSTNGMYLSISTIFFFCKYLKDKKKSSLIFTILSSIALLLTGKRAHTLFVIVTCIAIYIFHCREKILNKFLKLFIIIIIGVISLLCLSTVVPQILNVVDRFEESIAKGELLSGREPFYELALDLWSQNRIIGVGWGAFSYYFQTNLYGPQFTYGYLDAHNVYLQILCECGIIGFIFFISIAIYIFWRTWKNVKELEKDLTKDMYFYALFSFGFQIFFLLYCFTGNPLYDIQCYAVYFIVVGVTLQYKNYIQIKKLGENNEKSINNRTSL